jgi:hypothetical protein
MPITVFADDARRRLVAAATGKLTLSELQTFIRTERAGDRRTWPLILDLADASASISASDIEAVANTVGDRLRVEGPRAPVALIAADDLRFGLGRMYQTFCEQHGVDTVRVFRTRAQAEAWLAD